MAKRIGLGLLAVLALALEVLRWLADITKSAKEAQQGLEAVLGVRLGTLVGPLGYALMFLVIWWWFKIKSDETIAAIKSEIGKLASESEALKKEYAHKANDLSAKLTLTMDVTRKAHEALARLAQKEAGR